MIVAIMATSASAILLISLNYLKIENYPKEHACPYLLAF